LSEVGNIEKKFFEEHFKKSLDTIGSSKLVLVHFNGELSPDQITRLESDVENSILAIDVAKSPMRKIFFISVETLQNMLIHGHKDQ
jgi:hypothetical protein